MQLPSPTPSSGGGNGGSSLPASSSRSIWSNTFFPSDVRPSRLNQFPVDSPGVRDTMGCQAQQSFAADARASIRESSSDTPIRLPLDGPLVSLHFLFFLEFLNTILDSRDTRQTLTWLLDIGRSIVQIGSVVVHRLRQETECYAAVTNFVARNDQEAVFQTRVLGWQTGAGWREPAGSLISFLIVPISRCALEFQRPGWGQFTYSVKSLQNHFVNIVRQVRSSSTSADTNVAGIPTPNDWLLGWVAQAHLALPMIAAFDHSIATCPTFSLDDIHTPLSSTMVIPPRIFELQDLDGRRAETSSSEAQLQPALSGTRRKTTTLSRPYTVFTRKAFRGPRTSAQGPYVPIPAVFPEELERRDGETFREV
ncbi:unnamed protein product [Peniophora sp. CBMAI 1063]|nr:unnamed protein product [Peniophora sp. CBMAI 1063]